MIHILVLVQYPLIFVLLVTSGILEFKAGNI